MLTERQKWKRKAGQEKTLNFCPFSFFFFFLSAAMVCRHQRQSGRRRDRHGHTAMLEDKEERSVKKKERGSKMEKISTSQEVESGGKGKRRD